jgi:hypothetical protein
MSVGELAAHICTTLRDRGIEVVLSGGSCVSIYSAGKYVSNDLDFIETGIHAAREIRDAMLEMGFEQEHRYFKHDGVEFLVEFPRGPLAVGKEPVGSIAEIKFSTGLLRIISPTDCVKDRLAAYYHWQDQQCLEQAVLVAKSNEIDLQEVESWSKREGKSAEFRLIVERLRRR